MGSRLYRGTVICWNIVFISQEAVRISDFTQEVPVWIFLQPHTVQQWRSSPLSVHKTNILPCKKLKKKSASISEVCSPVPGLDFCQPELSSSCNMTWILLCVVQRAAKLFCCIQLILFFLYFLILLCNLRQSVNLYWDWWVQYAYMSITDEFKTESSWETKILRLQRKMDQARSYTVALFVLLPGKSQPSKDDLLKINHHYGLQEYTVIEYTQNILFSNFPGL